MGETPLLHRVELYICDACIDGIGQECHTPSCAMWLHSVDLPFNREALLILETLEPYTPDHPDA